MLNRSESAVIGFAIGTVAFLTTISAIKLYIYAAPKIGAIAHPTARGSHKVPIATGAGLPILIVFALFLSVLNILGIASDVWPYVFWATAITVLGYLDDLKPISLILRLFIQVIASFSLVILVGSFQLSPSIPQYIDVIVTSALLVIFINVFNFMDGSDGMIGLHGILVAFGWASVGIIRGDSQLTVIALTIAGAFAGFLVINWHPAKAFLGDSGSTFMGFLLAIFPMLGKPDISHPGGQNFLFVILFSWIFLFDASFSRIWRLVKETRFWEPNRDHFYQRLIDAGSSQSHVALLYGVLTTVMILATVIAIITGGAFTPILFACSISLPILLYLLSRKKGIDLNA